MRRIVSGLIIVLVVLSVVVPGPASYGLAGDFTGGGINEWIKATSPSTPFDFTGYGKLWKDSFTFSYAPYMKVYKFNVEKGEEYTLYMKMPMNEGYMNIDVTGKNPYADTMSYKDNTINGFIMYFQQPWAPRDSNLDAYRKNFKIASGSESTDLYVICTFEKPNKSFEFMLKTPKDSDDDVENSTVNTFVPERNGYTWGGVLETPLWLEASTSEESGSDMMTDTGVIYENDDGHYTEEIQNATGTVNDISLVNFDQTYSYTTGLEVDTLKLKSMYLDDWATSYQLYKVTLQPNQKYTFDFMHNTYNNINAFLIGENPFGTTPLNNSAGSNTILAAFQTQQYASLGYDEWYASRTQFTTGADSTGTTLYILVRAYYSGDAYKFKISKGYLSSKEETYNPYADSLNGFKWVTQWETPLKLWR